MLKFTDQSSASRLEKAKRVLRSLASRHDYRYFYDDGYPRQEDIQQDAAAALEVIEGMELVLEKAAVAEREAVEKERERWRQALTDALEVGGHLMSSRTYDRARKLRDET